MRTDRSRLIASGPLRARSALLTGALLILGSVPAQAAGAYTATELGLSGPGYVDGSGYRFAAAQFLNEAGDVAGYSQRIEGGSGYVAWLYSGGQTVQIGLTGTGYSSSAGYTSSFARQLNEAGSVIGYSQRYNGTGEAGQAAWLFQNGSTQQIGLIGAGYISSSGYAYNEAKQINGAGQIIGTAQRFSGSTDMGAATWLYDNGTSQRIGLTGAGFTRSDGWAYSGAEQLNAAGQVAGFSYSFNGSTSAGVATWLHSDGGAVRIGLGGSGFARSSDGYAFSAIAQLNDAGQVIGHAQRFNGVTDAGQSAWLYAGGTTQQIGLSGTGYTRSDGYAISAARQINESGEVVGSSRRYDGSKDLGEAAWFYQNGNTQQIGLAGNEYTRSDGYALSSVSYLNDAGQVAGSTSRFAGSTDLGQASWFFSNGSTRQIGLYGAGYSGSAGYAVNSVNAMNQAGQVAGNAMRYNGSGSNGMVAWLYDDDLDQTFAMLFSQRASDGHAYSYIHFLGEDGLVLGSYERYAGEDSLGEHAFAWTIAGGLQDLGALIEGGLPANWNSLAYAYRANSQGQIIGQTQLANGGYAGFLLSPVPEPEQHVLLMAGLLATALASRRQRRSTAA